MNEMLDKIPKISIVATTRNDNHGGDLRYRMQLFVDSIFEQAEKYKKNIELILVEWNPPLDKPKLIEALCWKKKTRYCDLRIITVPNEIHEKYQGGRKLPLYQMIGKNVGIRRAIGEFILATNIDVLFSDELFEFLISDDKINNKIYRVDRYDINNEIDISMNHDEKLNYCKNNLLRINNWTGTKSYIDNEYYKVYTDEVIELYNGNRINRPLNCNACGDFQMMAKEKWFDLNGYPELDMYSMHLDSVFEYVAHYSGMDEETLEYPMVSYHIEHESGFQPENSKLERRLESDKISSLDYTQLFAVAYEMGANNEPIMFNTHRWGLSHIKLTEYTIDEQGNQIINSGEDLSTNDYNPSEICNTKEWIYKVDNEMKRKMLLFDSKHFTEWFRKIIICRNFLIDTTMTDDEKNLIEVVKNNKKKIIVFGAGGGYKNFIQPVLKYFNIKPAYIVDNDLSKVGEKIYEIEVRRVNAILEENKDDILVYVSSMFYGEIKEQLEGMGYKEKKHFLNVLFVLNLALVDCLFNFSEMLGEVENETSTET